MPKGTKVDRMYQAMKREGMDKGKAARIAQAKTGKSLATGKPPKKKKKPETMEQYMKRKNAKGGM